MAKLLFRAQTYPKARVSMARGNNKAERIFKGRERETNFLPVSRTGTPISEAVSGALNFNVRVIGNKSVSSPEIAVDKSLTGDLMTDRYENIFATERFKRTLEKFDRSAADFVKAQLTDGVTGLALPENWYVVAFKKRMNPILEPRSNLLCVATNLSGNAYPKRCDDPRLFCRKSAVEGHTFWCGTPQTTEPGRVQSMTPDQIASPLTTYCSDSFYEAMVVEGLTDGWIAYDIEELEDNDQTTCAPFSPLVIHEHYIPTERVAHKVLYANPQSKNPNVGNIPDSQMLQTRPDNLLSQKIFDAYFDDDIPLMDLFSFVTTLFCSLRMKELLENYDGGEHLFLPVNLYSDVALTKKIALSDPYFILVPAALPPAIIPELCHGVAADIGTSKAYVRNTIYQYPGGQMALDADTIGTLNFWHYLGEPNDLYMTEDLIDAMNENGLTDVSRNARDVYRIWEPRRVR